MPDEPVPPSAEELPKYFLVRMEHDGRPHYIVCETVVSFDQSKLFQTAVRALQQVFQGFAGTGFAEVAPLPPLGDARWIGELATMEVGDVDGPP